MSPDDRIRGDRPDIAARFTADRPCPVCGAGTKSCSATADGLHLCRGEPGPGWREL